MILENGCNITKSETFKGVWILSVPTVHIQTLQLSTLICAAICTLMRETSGAIRSVISALLQLTIMLQTAICYDVISIQNHSRNTLVCRTNSLTVYCLL